MNKIETILNKYYLGDKRFKTNLDDYDFKSYSKNKKYPHSKNILFDPEYTNLGIFLRYNLKDIAVIGFDLNQESTNCKQIQGSKGAFKELTPIAWDKILLEELIKESKNEFDVKRVTILPHYLVKGDENIMKQEKIKKRYDDNALYHKFKFSNEEQLYILDL